MALADEVPHREQHAGRLQPSCVARRGPFKQRERIGLWIVVKCGFCHGTVVQHPCMGGVMGAAVRFLISGQNIQPILLPTDPGRPAVHDGDVGVSEPQRFQHRTLGLGGVELHLHAQHGTQVVRQSLRILVDGGVIVTHLVGDHQRVLVGILVVVCTEASRQRHEKQEAEQKPCFQGRRLAFSKFGVHHFVTQFRASEKSDGYEVSYALNPGVFRRPPTLNFLLSQRI